MLAHPNAISVNAAKKPRLARPNVPRMTPPFGELAEQFACPTLSSILGRGRGFQPDLCRVSPQMWINAATVGRWTDGRRRPPRGLRASSHMVLFLEIPGFPAVSRLLAVPGERVVLDVHECPSYLGAVRIDAAKNNAIP